jgi:hypothetical protein
MNYSKLWTQFETQSLAFGVLRKALYPTYLVRGYHGKIVIYRPTQDEYNPIPVLTVTVSASESKAQSGFFRKEDNEYLLIGGGDAWNIANLVKPLLTAAGEGPKAA